MGAELDYVVPPGLYIQEWLGENPMSQAALARLLGVSAKHVSKLVDGTASMTIETAQRLERVTGTPAYRWMQLETFYRSEQERLAIEADPEPAKDVLRLAPLADLRKIGQFTSTLNSVGACALEAMNFFGVGSMEALRERLTQPTVGVAYREGSTTHDWAARATWLRLMEREAAGRDATPCFDRDAMPDLIESFRPLTRTPPSHWAERIASDLAQVGVKVVFAPSLPKAGVYGATRWIDGAPVVGFSMHRKGEDQFWFTFFHEMLHLRDHQLSAEGFVSGEWGSSGKEEEADQFARNLLIPEENEPRLAALRTPADVVEFAEEIGVSPGIVVGRLRRDGIWDYTRGHSLVQKLEIKMR